MKQAKVKKHSAGLPAPQTLLKWYDKHRRLMPWRALHGHKPDPYFVWLSEIMLQQTTVATVGPYFQKFVTRWPTLNDLAVASLDDILRMWAGLGYYRRARMLHQCAQALHTTHNGIFPSDYAALLALPGFGPYTAAAVTAIAFDKMANVVDGNVERVMARIFAVKEALPKAKPKLRDLAASLVPQKRCGDYAQALMDLGATICTPRSPKCGLCPWQDNCHAYALGIQETLPRRTKKRPKPVRRAIAFVLTNDKGEILIRRRPSHGLLGDMMEIPTSPWVEAELPTLKSVLAQAPVMAKWVAVKGIVTHVFTHFIFEITVVAATTKGKTGKVKGQWIDPDKLSDEALPSVMKKIVRHALNSV